MQSDPSTTENPALQEMTERLARERDFYGFLASDMLDREYSMNHNAVPIDEQRLAAIKALPAMARARELMFHQDMLNANREWYQASAGFSDQDWLAAAIVAGQWQWHSKAIASLGHAQYWDDVELRFPLAYPNLIDNAGAAQRSRQLVIICTGTPGERLRGLSDVTGRRDGFNAGYAWNGKKHRAKI